MTLLLCFSLNMLGRGLSDSFAVFVLPLGREFGWSRAQMMGAYSISPEVLVAPRKSRPSTTIAPPMPVPTVITSRVMVAGEPRARLLWGAAWEWAARVWEALVVPQLILGRNLRVRPVLTF